jgi:hypothetical protein
MAVMMYMSTVVEGDKLRFFKGDKLAVDVNQGLGVCLSPNPFAFIVRTHPLTSLYPLLCRPRPLPHVPG